MQPDKDRIANTYIVGAPKSGTSAMAAWLDEHPEAFVCNPKEPFFWSDDYPRLQQRHCMTEMKQYRALFADAPSNSKSLIDGSTNYLASDQAIERIIDQVPDAKFIAMIRNPVQVVHAFHSEILFSGIETESDFETAWQLQHDRKRGHGLPSACEAPQFLQYAEVANYESQFKRFFSLVPQHQRHVILFDDFAADPAGAYRGVLDFLGLAPWEKQHFQKVNASHDHRFKSLSQLILNPPPILKPVIDASRSFARTQKGGWMDAMKQWLRVPKQRAAMSDEFKRELAMFFRPGIESTARILQTDLSRWLQESNTSLLHTGQGAQ